MMERSTYTFAPGQLTEPRHEKWYVPWHASSTSAIALSNASAVNSREKK